MEVVPASVGEASRRWDDKHLALATAADRIGGAPTSGFTPAVSGNAARFTAAWRRFAVDAGEECEARADSLRSTIREFLASDRAAYADLAALGAYLEERR